MQFAFSVVLDTIPADNSLATFRSMIRLRFGCNGMKRALPGGRSENFTVASSPLISLNEPSKTDLNFFTILSNAARNSGERLFDVKTGKFKSGVDMSQIDPREPDWTSKAHLPSSI